jgi:hypothetical protein
VEAVYEHPTRPPTYVSLKRLQPDDPGTRNFNRVIMRNKARIRAEDRKTPDIVGHTILHLETPHTMEHIEAQMAALNTPFMDHVLGHQPSNPAYKFQPSVFSQMALVCSDGDIVTTAAGGIVRRPRSP